MKETYDFLEKAGIFYLSTVDGDLPSCRPFGAIGIYNDKIYIGTNTSKNVSKQIAINNNVCIVACEGGNWIRTNCELVDDSISLEAKRAFLAANPTLAKIGYSSEDDSMQIFYMNNIHATIADAGGNISSDLNF